MAWTKQTKKTSDYTEEDKNTSEDTEQSKSTAPTWTEQDKS